MHNLNEITEELALDTGAVAIHVLNKLSSRQRQGRPTSLEDLVEMLSIRRADLRRVVSALHREGYLDATRMRLTLHGFAVGTSVDPESLPMLRRRRRPVRSKRAA